MLTKISKNAKRFVENFIKLYLIPIFSKYSIHEIYCGVIFINEYLLLHDRVQIRGIKIVGDLSGGGWSHISKLERKAVKLWGKTIGKSIPIRAKKLVVLNVSFDIFVIFYCENFMF